MQRSVASLSLMTIIGSSAAGHAHKPRSTAIATPTATISFSSDAG